MQGFVQRNQGILKTSKQMAQNYQNKQHAPHINFDATIQQSLINITLNASQLQQLRPHGIATDTSHIHVLISWRNTRPVKAIRISLKQSLNRLLNRQHKKRIWFSRGGSQKRVETQSHYQYLITQYLPKHTGITWFE